MADQAAEEDEQGVAEGGSLTEAQRQMLDRCLHALRHAKNDSQTLAALLLMTRLCPANQLDKSTVRRIFDAVGLNLLARLLVTAVRGADGSALPPQELLSLGAALLAALSADPVMAAHPQLLATVPLLLDLLADGWVCHQQNRAGVGPEDLPRGPNEARRRRSSAGDEGSDADGSAASRLEQAVAADCFQVLTAVCALPRGPEQLLNRGAVPALCRAVEQNRTPTHQRALSLLGILLCSKAKEKAWRNHQAELLSLLLRLSRDLLRSADLSRFQMCSSLVVFLPPAGVASQSEELKEAVSSVWAALRPMLQAKLTPKQMGPVLVLGACLLDLYGWESAGSPKFCCLLVNRACVEVRMALEEPPGNDLSAELQNTLTGCYRIMEAAMEQACTSLDAAPPPGSSLSLQQSQQVLGVLQEAFSAVMFHLQQVGSAPRLPAVLLGALRLTPLVFPQGGPKVSFPPLWTLRVLSFWEPKLLFWWFEPEPGSPRGQESVPVDQESPLGKRGSALLHFREFDRENQDPAARETEPPADLDSVRPVHRGSSPPGPAEAAQRRFFSAALRLLQGALRSSSGSGPVSDGWKEAAELWRLSLQALGGCVRTQPWIVALIRDEGWLKHGVLTGGGASPDPQTEEVLEEVLCAVAERCQDCRQEIREMMRSGGGGALRMKSLRKMVGV
ncbi:neurochondrin [Cyprinodon tularosa]|uniref:neurochondrin n=1 Tax=Cyprinodon tularosa TaxID=77115 RepID=UPI0018E1DBBB|nr:neurochondrin [Cyprinodon tularosa]